MGCVRWGTPVLLPPGDGSRGGVYVVALSDELASTHRSLLSCPVSPDALRELLEVRPELTLDGARPRDDDLGQRLSAFWLPDEVVLYIGQTERQTLPKRIAQYYRTPLGARSPHAGGWPLKTLSCLSELYVHYAYCPSPQEAESAMLDAFAGAASDHARLALHDTPYIMPFANLRDGQGRLKNHGIKGAKAPR